ENQNFIVSSFAVTVNGVPVTGGHQWIAWDAVDKKIRSWSFFAGGGFGEGVWAQEGKKWTIRLAGKSSAGKKVSMTNVVTQLDIDHVTLQVTHLTVDGKEMPQGALVKLKRVKGDQPPGPAPK